MLGVEDDVANWLPSDIQVLKTYGAAPYANALRKLDKQINEKQNSVNEKIGIKVCWMRFESDGMVLGGSSDVF